MCAPQAPTLLRSIACRRVIELPIPLLLTAVAGSGPGGPPGPGEWPAPGPSAVFGYVMPGTWNDALNDGWVHSWDQAGVGLQVNIAKGTNGLSGPKAVPVPAAILLPGSGLVGIAGIKEGIIIKKLTILNFTNKIEYLSVVPIYTGWSWA